MELAAHAFRGAVSDKVGLMIDLMHTKVANKLLEHDADRKKRKMRYGTWSSSYGRRLHEHWRESQAERRDCSRKSAEGQRHGIRPRRKMQNVNLKMKTIHLSDKAPGGHLVLVSIRLHAHGGRRNELGIAPYCFLIRNGLLHRHWSHIHAGGRRCACPERKLVSQSTRRQQDVWLHEPGSMSCLEGRRRWLLRPDFARRCNFECTRV